MENHKDLVKDYFEVCGLLNKVISDYSLWEARELTLLVVMNGIEEELTALQISRLIEIDVDKVNSFFCVYYILSNRLDLLIGQREYKSWSVSDSKIIVTFMSTPEKTYTSADIERAIRALPKES